MKTIKLDDDDDLYPILSSSLITLQVTLYNNGASIAF